MSEEITKNVIRFRIPQLKGKSVQEAFDFFTNTIGEPEEIDKYDGELEYFNYKEKYSVHEKNDEWYFDIVLSTSESYDNYFCMTFRDLLETTEEISEKFEILDIENINILCYTWYTGVDEPINFID
jgi:hypothetical protein